MPKVPSTPALALVKIQRADYPSFIDEGDTAGLAEAVGRSLAYLSKLSPDKEISFGPDRYAASEMAGALEDLRQFLLTSPSPETLSHYVADRFDVYMASGEDGQGGVVFTGYYTPEMPASRAPDDTFRFPLYGLPGDLVVADLGLFREKYKGDRLAGMVKDGAFVPYYTRSEIDGGGALSGRGLELAWVADPVGLFFVQVQGSGVLSFPDGTAVHVNYAGANGRPYRSIGRLMIEQGKADLDTMSMEWLKGYLNAHKDEAQAIMDYNESYVFFKLEDEGPYGNLGTPVTPGRTVAADKSLFPAGALAYVDTEVPEDAGAGKLAWRPYSRFVLDQDSGGAIKGPGRADIYFGYGDGAEFAAGYMRRAGRLYYLTGRRGAQP